MTTLDMLMPGAPKGRFDGIERPYTIDQVTRLRGSLPGGHCKSPFHERTAATARRGRSIEYSNRAPGGPWAAAGLATSKVFC